MVHDLPQYRAAGKLVVHRYRCTTTNSWYMAAAMYAPPPALERGVNRGTSIIRNRPPPLWTTIGP